MLRLVARVVRPVDFKWVQGHKDSFFNKRADKLAKTRAKAPVLRGPLDARKVRRKTTTEMIQRGSVEMSGQQMTIRLFEEVDQSDQGLVRSSTRCCRSAAHSSGRLATSGLPGEHRCEQATPTECV